jgi:hypothetical protein
VCVEFRLVFQRVRKVELIRFLAFSSATGGACATEGGVDCTGLPGVEAVGCVAGVCTLCVMPFRGLERSLLTLDVALAGEIWSCQDGYTWDAATASCKA